LTVLLAEHLIDGLRDFIIQFIGRSFDSSHPHGLPATVSPKHYVAIHPGTSMLLTHAKAFLDNFLLPLDKRSKGGGKNGQLIFG
jgi:hypothetical protein